MNTGYETIISTKDYAGDIFEVIKTDRTFIFRVTLAEGRVIDFEKETQSEAIDALLVQIAADHKEQ